MSVTYHCRRCWAHRMVRLVAYHWPEMLMAAGALGILAVLVTAWGAW